MDHPTRRFHPLILGLVVFLATWIMAIPTMPGAPGLTWDETYYSPTFHQVATWTGWAFSNPDFAFSEEGIDAGWRRINELPPVVKWIGALTVSLPHPGGWWHLATMRLFPTIAFGFTVGMLLAIGRRFSPGWWAWIAPAVYTLHPHLWGHGQIAATESVFAAVTVLAIWIALQDLTRWRWRLALVLVAALALATKINGVILLSALMAWLLSGRILERRLSRFLFANDVSLIFAMLVVSPFLALSIWPWMWHDTAARLHEYYLFVREHAHQGVWYMGRLWGFNAPPAPASYPVIMAHLMTPLSMVALFWLAILGGLSRFIAQRRIRRSRLLLVLMLLAPLTASSLPGTPKYDGIRLFLPMFVPAALLVGIGLHDLAAWLRLMGRKSRAGTLVLAVLLLVVVEARPRPNIDYYNPIARLYAHGQTVFPFEQTYWLNAFDARAVADLNRVYPPGSRFMTRGFHGDTLPTLQSWGVLNPDFEVSGQLPIDAHIIQNRRGFWGNSDWTIWQERAPLMGWGSGPTGEPLVFLYDGRPPGSGPLPTGTTGLPE